jgi:hypothetical protein
MGPLRFRRGFAAWIQVALYVLSCAIALGTVAQVVSPAFRDVHLLGGHDWDQQESYRYLVKKSVLRFHQFPFWNPYSCGGHPAWGYFEGDTTVVSPFFPAYLALPFPLAIRVEIVGNALFSALGAWLLAGRFTRSPAARALVVVLFSVNGRWALQVATGHTWHMAYDWTPWALYFLDRAFDDWTRKGAFPARSTIYAGICFAMMVYMGGIYPLPQTMVAVAIYSSLYSIALRDWRPVLCSVAAGVLSFGLSAPKLLPVLEVLARFPRFTDSPEYLDLGMFVALLTSRDQDVHSQPAPTPMWGWHEYGMYIGGIPFVLLFVGMFVARSERSSALKWTAVVLIALGFGSFHPYAPWTLLHKVPIFKSQHVPSRWLYPALLVTATVTAAAFERLMTRTGWVRSWFEMAALVAVGTIASDVAKVAQLPLVNALIRPPPAVEESVGEFRTEIHTPPEIESAGRDWAPTALPAEIANIGTTDCGTFGAFHNVYRDHNGHAPGLGAKGRGDPAYRGEVYVVEGDGKVEMTKWSPNEMVVEIVGAKAGDHVSLNQNYDAGWLANGSAAYNSSDVVTAVINSSNETVVFRYRPRLWWPGVGIFAVTVFGLGWSGWRLRRSRARARRPPRPLTTPHPAVES